MATRLRRHLVNAECDPAQTCMLASVDSHQILDLMKRAQAENLILRITVEDGDRELHTVRAQDDRVIATVPSVGVRTYMLDRIVNAVVLGRRSCWECRHSALDDESVQWCHFPWHIEPLDSDVGEDCPDFERTDM